MPNLHQKHGFSNHKTNNVGAVLHRPTIGQARTLLSYIELRPDYDTWLRTVSAIGNTFDEQTALELLLKFFQDEKPGEHLYQLRHRLRNITFATLVWLAKQRGFVPTTEFYANSPTLSRKLPKNTRNHRISFDDVRNQRQYFVRFDDEKLEKLRTEIQEGYQLSRFDAQRLILLDNPSAATTSVYELSINPHGKDKNWDYDILNRGFENKMLSAEEIASAVRLGWALCNAKLSSVRRCNANFQSSQLVFIDVDGEITLEQAFADRTTQDALLIYTTASHTSEQHRFRVIFALPFIETDATRYKSMVTALQQHYSADPATSAVVQTFYGSTKGRIWLMKGGQYVEY